MTILLVSFMFYGFEALITKEFPAAAACQSAQEELYRRGANLYPNVKITAAICVAATKGT